MAALGGEFVFNCYPKNDQGLLRWLRFHGVYRPLRAVLRRAPFGARLAYARLMGMLRVVPGLGLALEKAGFCVCGEALSATGGPPSPRDIYRATVLNTFDGFGGHRYQHHKSEAELRALVSTLQPDVTKILNLDRYFRRPPPIGCALRLCR